jgi:hypothetical protein
MALKSVALVASTLILSTNATAATIFSISQTVTSVDRSATFDALISNGISLNNYAEDSLFITVNDTTFQGFTAFSPGDFRTTGFHYGTAGNYGYVSISGTDNQTFTAIDFLLGDGASSNDTNIQWETYLGGVLISTGLEIGVQKGQIVGWSDTQGFDELRVAALGSEPLPGFGNFQAIAIDDLRAQVVPIPSAVWLFGSGLLGLISVARRKVRI